jgi:hypothetical protein
MRALQIELNGKTLAIAGSDAAMLLSGGVNLSIHEVGGTLDVSGMEDLGNDIHAHLYWIEMLDLAHGDRVTIKFLDATAATSPSEVLRTDSPEHASAQSEYEDNLRENPPTAKILESAQPEAKLALCWNGSPAVVASFENGREFICCRFTWNSFRPDRCRVTLSSFSQVEALARTGSRDWFSGTLNIGESCEIELTA